MARLCNAYNLVDNRRPMLSLVFVGDGWWCVRDWQPLGKRAYT